MAPGAYESQQHDNTEKTSGFSHLIIPPDWANTHGAVCVPVSDDMRSLNQEALTAVHLKEVPVSAIISQLTSLSTRERIQIPYHPTTIVSQHESPNASHRSLT